MTAYPHLQGVFAAALTPLNPDYSPALKDLPVLLDFLARRGCHGALLLGTTGEGPSFSPGERQQILRAALEVRQQHPAFRLLAGTGTPSLDETIELTRAAFDLGLDGVVVLPPYYYRAASEAGLFAWFSEVLRRAVPSGGAFFGYHIPGVSGVPLSLDLLARLAEAFPGRFAGLKDSSADPEHAVRLGARFGDELLVYNGSDRLFALALRHHGGGCITAMANLVSPFLRRVWRAHRAGGEDPAAQAHLETARRLFEDYPPAPALLKALLPRTHGLPHWAVKPPLAPLDPVQLERALQVAETIPAEGETA
jgi:4-hydroxy-tetrahydrodipicolinate synthase